MYKKRKNNKENKLPRKFTIKKRDTWKSVDKRGNGGKTRKKKGTRETIENVQANSRHREVR